MRWIFFVVMFLPGILFSQEYECKIEISVDTVTAYKIYYDGWEQNGFVVGQKTKKDSIGIRIEQVTKLFYVKDGKKVYIMPIERKYISGEKDQDARYWHY